jgi:hypothetical protein
MKPASDSLVLKSDYTILLKDDAENNKVESRRKRARLKMDGKGFHSHSYDEDNFVDELNDSLHLTRVRLENCDTRQIVEMGIGSRASTGKSELIQNMTSQYKRIEAFITVTSDNLSDSQMSTNTTQDCMINRAKAA